jgi:hypothetical protein
VRFTTCSAILAMATCAQVYATDASYTRIAREFTDGVPWLKTGIPIPINDAGQVAFPTETPGTFLDQLHTYNAGTLTPIPLTPGGYNEVRSVAIDNAGNVAFVAHRTQESNSYRGVYKTTVAAAPIATYHEDLQGPNAPETRFVAMSGNGTVAFSNLTSSANGGAVHRGPINGSPSVLRSWSGTFYNTQMSDVNDSGTVATQFEYGSPVGPLSRGILVMDTPEQTITQVKTVIEQTGVGVQPMPSMNNLGQVAFSLDETITMNFYNTPNVFGSGLASSITLQPGVYVAEPALLGQTPRSITQIANLDGDYKSFGRVVINDNGIVLFEASLDSETSSGIFSGADPVADLLVKTGQVLESGPVLSVIELGDLNNNNQFTFLTSQFGAPGRSVWVATIPEPTTLGLLAPAIMGLLRRRR